MTDSEYIGMASMDEHGNIVLDLRAEGDGGVIGIARLVYEPTHAQYQDILVHLGGLRPGDAKPVRPFPESS